MLRLARKLGANAGGRALAGAGLRRFAGSSNPDVVIVGAGHNGLVASILLARQGLKVKVYEEKDMVGGACKTEYPFPKVPGLGHSTGAYLLGVMPPELITVLGIDIPMIRRDPHYFLPTTGDKYLMFGSDANSLKRDFFKFFSEEDWIADQKLQAEIGKIRDDLSTTWLQEPLSIEETAAKYVRKELQTVFLDLCRKPIGDYLDRFGFKSDLLRAMYAVTDGFTGLTGSWETPGTGMNFLAHNMCRLPGSGGTWMLVEGGMGVVTQKLALAAKAAGVNIHTGAPVANVAVNDGAATGIVLQDGTEVNAKVVLVNADPFRCRSLVGEENFPQNFNKRLDSMRRNGTTLKVNLALKGLPQFNCLKTAGSDKTPDFGQWKTTTHLLPDEDKAIETLTRSFADAEEGRLPDFPAIEWYFHSPLDPSLQDKAGHHSAALFVQWVPYTIKGSTWEKEEAAYVAHLLSICDTFAPGTSELVADMHVLTPPKIEQHFGITGGHIHHVDNTYGFADRFPYATPVSGLYSCSAGCHPGGAVTGAAGHNAAARIVRDLGLTPNWPTA